MGRIKNLKTLANAGKNVGEGEGKIVVNLKRLLACFTVRLPLIG
jgi:hypothetical protein